MLYSALDSGNFLVIPGSPADVWAVELFSKTHSKYQVRENSGIQKEDLVVVVIGCSFSYNELSWDHSLVMHSIEPLLVQYARKRDGGSYKFAFLDGNSTDEHNHALQVLSRQLNFCFISLDS